MIYKFNDADIRAYGVLPCRDDGGIALSGMFDFPQRKGTTEYNWGDRIEPYVAAPDLTYGGRSLGLKLVMPDLADLSRFREAYLDCRTLVTELGSFRVVAAGEVKVEKAGEKMGLIGVEFLEPQPVFPELTFPGSGGEGLRLDHYHLERDLGVYVAAVKDGLNLPKRIEVGTTATYPDTRYRENGTITLECVMKAGDLRAVAVQMGQLHALCAQPGLRTLRFPDGTTRQAYVKEGFKVKVTGESTVNFSLKMEVL